MVCKHTIASIGIVFVNNQECLYSKRPAVMGILRVQLQCKSGFLATGGQIGGVSVFVKAELQEGSDTARSFLSLTKLYKYC